MATNHEPTAFELEQFFSVGRAYLWQMIAIDIEQFAEARDSLRFFYGQLLNKHRKPGQAAKVFIRHVLKPTLKLRPERLTPDQRRRRVERALRWVPFDMDPALEPAVAKLRPKRRGPTNDN